jgi:voltage-gated potassium channel
MPLYSSIPPAAGRRQLRKWQITVLRSAGLLLLTLLGCMAGLLLLDDATAPLSERLFRALWNAANTISTLGDLESLNHGQKMFMIGAMFTLISVGGYAVSTLTGVLSSDDVLAYREYRRVEKSLAALSGHIILAGFGVISRRAAKRLHEAGNTVVIVEFDEAAAQAASSLGYLTVLLSAGRDEALVKARLDTAAALLVTLHDADRKLALTLIARSINPKLPIVALDDTDADESWLPHAGATRVVLMDELVSQALVDSLAKAMSGS